MFVAGGVQSKLHDIGEKAAAFTSIPTAELFASSVVKVPAWVETLLANRDVSKYPPIVSVGSVIVTVSFCVTPGVYVMPEGNVTVTPPPAVALPL